MVKNLMASVWKSLQGFKLFNAEKKPHQLARKDGFHPNFNALNSCSQQTQTKRVQQLHKHQIPCTGTEAVFGNLGVS